MKVSEILNEVNTFEKNNFLRVVDQIISSRPKEWQRVEKILSEIDGQIKNADHLSVETIFAHIESEYSKYVKDQFQTTTNQLDIIVDILIRDGNSLMSREWLLKLYEKEIKKISAKVSKLQNHLTEDEDDLRIRDYKTYKACVEIAYLNDDINNRERKVTSDEQSIINTLANCLELSHEEIKLLNYSVVPLKKMEVDDLLNLLVKSGIVFYSKKNHQVYVPDQVISILRDIRGKLVPNKIYKRILYALKPSQINLIAKKHNIPYKFSREDKIRAIISEGINLFKLLTTTIHKPQTTKTDKKKALNYIIENGLNISDKIKGAAFEDKVTNFIAYLNERDEDDSISISLHGFDKLLTDLSKSITGFRADVHKEFELQETVELTGQILLAHGLKPIDILSVLTRQQVEAFCNTHGISVRGDELSNILDAYRDIKNLYLENYISISNRDLAALKQNNIEIKEANLGLQYESLTKHKFSSLRLNVDDDLRKQINTKKDQIDIVINLGNNEIIIVECKTKKDRKFSTYSSASRQIKAYKSLAEQNDLRVVKSFIVAPNFTNDFINDCGLDYDLNLSLITSEALVAIHKAFKDSPLEEFPYKILLRDVLIDSDRVVRSISQ